MSREEVEFLAAFEMTGERFRPAFFAVFSLAAAPCAKLEQKVNFCLHAYAVHGIYVYSGIRVAEAATSPGPAHPQKIQILPKRPTPSPLFTELRSPMPRVAEAADYASSGASASRECLVERWIASLRSQ